jgi:hypothetical protein
LRFGKQPIEFGYCLGFGSDQSMLAEDKFAGRRAYDLAKGIAWCLDRYRVSDRSSEILAGAGVALAKKQLNSPRHDRQKDQLIYGATLITARLNEIEPRLRRHNDQSAILDHFHSPIPKTRFKMEQ